MPHQPTHKSPKQTPWMLSTMNTTLTQAPCIAVRKKIYSQSKRAYDRGWLEKKDAHDQPQKRSWPEVSLKVGFCSYPLFTNPSDWLVRKRYNRGRLHDIDCLPAGYLLVLGFDNTT
jgi:hypothetical protein